jgi:hypothetical protein
MLAAVLAFALCITARSSSSSSSESRARGGSRLRPSVDSACYRAVEADEFGAPGCFRLPNAPSCGGNTSDSLPPHVVEIGFLLHNSGPDDYELTPNTSWDHRGCTDEQYFGQDLTYALYSNATGVPLTPNATSKVCLLDDCDDESRNTHILCNATQGVRAHCDARVSHDPFRLPCHWIALNNTAYAYVTSGHKVTVVINVNGVEAHRTLTLHKCHAPISSAVWVWVLGVTLFCCFLLAIFAVVARLAQSSSSPSVRRNGY